MSYEDWMTKAAPTYMQDAFGAAWMGGIGATIDDYVQLYIAGVKAAFPDYAPSDALGVIGDELGIDRGPNESDASYAARLTAAWSIWRLAGTAGGLLTALYFGGFPNVAIVQQNGIGYALSSSPSPGADPISQLVVTPLDQLDAPLTPVPPATKTIPAGTSWWTFDGNNDFTGRFQVLFTGAASPLFTTYATATFTGAEDSIAVTWNNVFADTTYKVQVGPPTITDGSGGISVIANGTTKTTTGITIVPSGRFSGTVDVLAYQATGNPFADPHPADLARIKNLITKWRPAKAQCVNVSVAVQGYFWGWPVTTWGTRGNWVPCTIVNLPGTWS